MYWPLRYHIYGLCFGKVYLIFSTWPSLPQSIKPIIVFFTFFIFVKTCCTSSTNCLFHSHIMIPNYQFVKYLFFDTKFSQSNRALMWNMPPFFVSRWIRKIVQSLGRFLVTFRKFFRNKFNRNTTFLWIMIFVQKFIYLQR